MNTEIKKESEVVHRGFSTKVIRETDDTFSVDTPISYERGFSNFEDANKYDVTYGGIDKRIIQINH